MDTPYTIYKFFNLSGNIPVTKRDFFVSHGSMTGVAEAEVKQKIAESFEQFG